MIAPNMWSQENQRDQLHCTPDEDKFAERIYIQLYIPYLQNAVHQEYRVLKLRNIPIGE
jgi:hypothetical protein